jgi:hypothetical protein
MPRRIDVEAECKRRTDLADLRRKEAIEQAEKKYEQTLCKIKIFKEATIKMQSSQSRMSKDEKEARERLKAITQSTVPLTSEVQKTEEQKREEVRAQNISTVFNMLGFDDEEIDSESDSEMSFTEEEIKEAAERNKKILMAPPPPVEPELTEDERAKLRQKSLEDDRQTLTKDKQTIVNISNVQQVIIQSEKQSPITQSPTPPPAIKKTIKRVIFRKPVKTIGAAKTYGVPTSRLASSSLEDEEEDSCGTPEP